PRRGGSPRPPPALGGARGGGPGAHAPPDGGPAAVCAACLYAGGGPSRGGRRGGGRGEPRGFPPLCWTRANHNGNRASTVPQAAAPPTKTGSSPTAVISSSATGRAPGSAAKNRTAPSGGSAKFSQPKALNARTYPAPGAA